jgi:ribonuclease T2
MMSFSLKDTALTSRSSPVLASVPGRRAERRRPLTVAGLLGALLAIAFCGALRAQLRPFDYYVFSLSWAPEFCAQPGETAANPRECASGQVMRFVVHGLWPQASEGRSPESCGSSGTVSKGLVNDILPYMPSPGLIQHEWATHGSCTGLSQGNYFTRILLARAAVQIPVQITSIRGTETESPGQIEEQFAESNPSFPKGAFRTGCRDGAFTEIRACFDKELKARACTVSVGECGSPTVTIRPPK